MRYFIYNSAQTNKFSTQPICAAKFMMTSSEFYF